MSLETPWSGMARFFAFAQNDGRRVGGPFGGPGLRFPGLNRPKGRLQPSSPSGVLWWWRRLTFRSGARPCPFVPTAVVREINRGGHHPVRLTQGFSVETEMRADVDSRNEPK